MRGKDSESPVLCQISQFSNVFPLEFHKIPFLRLISDLAPPAFLDSKEASGLHFSHLLL